MKFNLLRFGIVVCVLLLEVGCQGSQAVAAGDQGVKEQVVKVQAAVVVAEPSIEAKVPITTEPNFTGAKLTVENAVYDFGNVGPGSKNVCEFKFKNTGTSLLKIKKVIKTCGCTPFTLEKKEYAPGESGTLKVQYNAGKHEGKTTRRLYITSNDKTNPKLELLIKANVTLNVAFEPKRVKLSLRKENADCPAIKIRSIDGKPFAIKSFKSRPDCISADVNDLVVGTEHVIEPKVDMAKLQKMLKGRITIGISHPDTDTVIIPFEALSEFKVTPASIITFNAEAQKPLKRTLWVLSNYDEDFEIESAKSQKGTVNVLSNEKTGKRYKLELEIIPPKQKKGEHFFADNFLLKIKDGPELKINCRAFYKKKEKQTK